MLSIEPHAGPAPVVNVIRHAHTEVDMSVYELTSRAVIRALQADCSHGIKVRLILDTRPYRGRRVLDREKRHLAHMCVDWKPAPPRFQGHYVFSHAKYVIADPGSAHARAELGTANFTWSAFHKNREYLWTTKSAALVGALDKVFRADWNRQRAGSAPRQHLVLSPGSAPALLHVIRQSGTVDIEAEELGSAHRILHALEHKGDKVRLILPRRMNHYERRRVAELKHAGVRVRTLSHPYLHAKMIVGKRLAFIGSENFSDSSLYKNREVGVLLADRHNLSRLRSQFAHDWRKAR